MNLSQAFILNRRQKSLAVYAAIAADWEWDEQDVEAFNEDKAAVEAKVDEAEGLRLTMLEKRDALDAALDAIATKTLTIVGLARVKFRGNKLKRSALGTLSARSDSRTAQRLEAKALVKAWPKLDPAWVPLPGLTLAAYTTERNAIEGIDSATPPADGLVDFYENAHGLWRAGAEDLGAMLGALEEKNEAWYAAASVVFPAGTANGDLIRGQVPTTYDPSNEPLPVPGKPTGVSAGPGTSAGTIVVVCLPKLYASTYTATVTWEDSGGPQTRTASASTNTVEVTELPSGQNVNVTVTASNATGESAPSTAVNVNVP